MTASVIRTKIRNLDKVATSLLNASNQDELQNIWNQYREVEKVGGYIPEITLNGAKVLIVQKEQDAVALNAKHALIVTNYISKMVGFFKANAVVTPEALAEYESKITAETKFVRFAPPAAPKVGGIKEATVEASPALVDSAHVPDVASDVNVTTSAPLQDLSAGFIGGIADKNADTDTSEDSTETSLVESNDSLVEAKADFVAVSSSEVPSNEDNQAATVVSEPTTAPNDLSAGMFAGVAEHAADSELATPSAPDASSANPESGSVQHNTGKRRKEFRRVIDVDLQEIFSDLDNVVNLLSAASSQDQLDAIWNAYKANDTDRVYLPLYTQQKQQSLDLNAKHTQISTCYNEKRKEFAGATQEEEITKEANRIQYAPVSVTSLESPDQDADDPSENPSESSQHERVDLSDQSPKTSDFAKVHAAMADTNNSAHVTEELNRDIEKEKRVKQMAKVTAQIAVIREKSKELTERNDDKAAALAGNLANNLDVCVRDYVDGAIVSLVDFKEFAKAELNSVAELSNHRGVLKTIIHNTLAIIFTLGASMVYNRCVNGSFFFKPETDSAAKVRVLSDAVEAVSDAPSA